MLVSAITAASAHYRRDLGDGLVLRWSNEADAEHIAELVGRIFRSNENEGPNTNLINQVRRLMRPGHPNMTPNDYAVVEDTKKEGNPIVACTCLFRHVWEYEGTSFTVGRPEIVASDPNYRNRGLIRSLFEIVHARSQVEGHPVQAITGIPHFYRQFGYEYALDLHGSRSTYFSLIPKAKEGEAEPFTLREATLEDVPVIQRAYNRRRASSMVWAIVPDSYWQYEIEAWHNSPEKDASFRILMIVDATGAACGYLLLNPVRWESSIDIWNMGTIEGINLQRLMPVLLRAIQSYSPHLPTGKADTAPASKITFSLGRSHPVYEALGEALAPFYEAPYAWYIRVRDLPAFLRLLAPVLERRLASSDLVGYSGELKIDHYRGGLRMAFEDGRLKTAEHWKIAAYDSSAQAGFPALTFLQLIFGHRSVEDLCLTFPDCWVNNEARYLLKTLFPQRLSSVMIQ